MAAILPFPSRRPTAPQPQAPAADLLADCCRLLAGFPVHDVARHGAVCAVLDKLEPDDMYDLKMSMLPLIRAIEKSDGR